MGFLNKVVLLGNVTRQPEVRYIPGKDLPVAKFGLAVNRKTKDREETCFIDIVTFGRTAEMCGEYVTKGDADTYRRQAFIQYLGTGRPEKKQTRGGGREYSVRLTQRRQNRLR